MVSILARRFMEAGPGGGGGGVGFERWQLVRAGANARTATGKAVARNREADFRWRKIVIAMVGNRTGWEQFACRVSGSRMPGLSWNSPGAHVQPSPASERFL